MGCQVHCKWYRHNILGSQSKIAEPGPYPSAGWKVLPWVPSRGGCGWPGTTWPLPRELFNISHEKIVWEMCPCCFTACFCASLKQKTELEHLESCYFWTLVLFCEHIGVWFSAVWRPSTQVCVKKAQNSLQLHPSEVCFSFTHVSMILV